MDIMDEYLWRNLLLFANSKNQLLSHHSLGVANLSLAIFNSFNFSESDLLKVTFENIDKLKENIFLAGLLHDIGKIDANFQDFLKNKNATDSKDTPLDGVHYLENKEKDTFSFLNYPRHNELSWAISSQLLSNEKEVLYAVFFHHAQVKRDVVWDNCKMLMKAYKDENIMSFSVKSFFDEILKNENSCSVYRETILSLMENISNLSFWKNEKDIPAFLFKAESANDYLNNNMKEKDLIEIKNLLLRSIVVSADRIISSISAKELSDCVEDNSWEYLLSSISSPSLLETEINEMLSRFIAMNETNPLGRLRDTQQSEIAKKLSSHNDVATLFGPAGCGKTKIFLEWYSNKLKLNPGDKNKKLYIIAPRKMICFSLFNELREQYIPNSKIELLTGENKLFWDGERVTPLESLTSQKIESEVVITTIDQLVSIMLSHTKIDLLADFLNSYVIFDEFHEFFNIAGIVLLFKFFMKLKIFKENSKTLLVSATPNYFLLEDVLGVSKEAVEYIDTFNKQPYKFIFSKYLVDNKKSALEESFLFEKQKEGSIIIFNTATKAQSSTLDVQGEDVICFHSKFTGADKAEIYNEIKNNWSNKHPSTTKVLRSGPIVQASLNISTMNLVTQVCSAENWCQRIGRANRFASDIDTAVVTTVLSDKTIEGITANNSEAHFLDKVSIKNQTFAWVDYFLNKNFSEFNWNDKNEISVVLSLSNVYEQYREFHSLPSTKSSYLQDFTRVVEDSMKIFSKNDFTPFEYWKKPKKKKGERMSSLNIRGSSVFVLPLKYDVYKKSLNEWLYIPSEDLDMKNLLAVSENFFDGKAGLIHNHKEILSKMRIDGFANAGYEKMSYYKNMTTEKIKKEAKNSTSPLLLSFEESVPNSKVLNQEGWFYVTKGKVKVGLFENKYLFKGN